MKVLILQHAEGEWLGSMEAWFNQKQAELTTVRLDHGELLPDITSYDWLIIMGGPMSAYDEAKYPWLIEEKNIIRQAIDQEKIVLGICLGAQLIANTLGAIVKPNTQTEIGWFEVTRTHPIASWLPERFTPLSWHGDIVELPSGAVGFAKSDITPCQGFQWKEHVVGLQFHLEVQAGTAATFLGLQSTSLPQGKYIQDTASLLNDKEQALSSSIVMHKLLDTLHQRN